MQLPRIIQGGMGAAISTWTLARAVALEGGLGVVSGTGIGLVLLGRLAARDGPTLAALSAFPDQEIAQALVAKHLAKEGETVAQAFKLPEMWTLKESLARDRLVVLGAFVEVWLAKRGHQGQIGINVLEKASMPNLATLYGAMLGDVDWVLMGAGIPLKIPGAPDALSRHEAATYPVQVDGAGAGDAFHMSFVPEAVFPGLAARGPLRRPRFVPIISTHVLAQALLKRADGKIDGFVVEHHTAGGHNAPPRGKLPLDGRGEPVYGARDEADLDVLKRLGLPFWLAGGTGSAEGLLNALSLGAAGIQAGTAFAYCNESGMEPGLRQRILHSAVHGGAHVRTDPLASPTGFPFKVVDAPGTLSDHAVRDARDRVCNIGILRQPYKREDGTVGYRCPSEPADQFVKKGGLLSQTEERVCLCNGLMATAGFPLQQRNGAAEPALVTSGDDLAGLARFLGPQQESYSAADVLRVIGGGMRGPAIQSMQEH